MEERVRPEERRRYVFLLGFNLVAGLVWLVTLLVTGVWYVAVLLAICVVLGSMSAWALAVLRREGTS